jgi:hypothetical protein
MATTYVPMLSQSKSAHQNLADLEKHTRLQPREALTAAGGFPHES